MTPEKTYGSQYHIPGRFILKIAIPKLRFSECLYFGSFAVYLIFSLLGTSFYAVYIDFASGFIKAACVLTILFSEIFQKNTQKSIVSFFILGVFSVMTLFTGVTGIIPTLLFTYAARNIRFTRILKVAGTVSSVVLVFVILSALIGVIPNYMMARSTGVKRYCLGFRYVLYAPVILFNITAITIYLKKSAIRWRTIWLLLALNYIMYLPTNARLSFGLSCLNITAAVALKVWPDFLQKRKALCALLVSMFIVCFVGSLALCILYDSSNPTLRAIDEFMGGRIAWGKTALMRYSFGLIGKKVAYNGFGLDMYGSGFRGTYFYVDNLYIQALQRFGAVFMVGYVLLNTFAMYRCCRRKEWHLLAIMAVLALRGLIDDLSFSLYYNTFWIVIGPMVLGGLPHKGQMAVMGFAEKHNYT